MLDIFQDGVTNILRVMASGLRIPVMILLIVLAGLTLFLLGTLIAETFLEHRHLTEKMPEMVDKIEAASMKDLPGCIEDGRLLLRQKDALLELTGHPDLTPLMRESLAIRLIAQERDYYDGRVRYTDLIAKLGPMLGLMGTLIPLGPGVIALGQGDTYTLSTSLLMAFDTTVAGLACAAVALVISNVRKKWYKNYMSMLETLMECTLEAVNQHQKKNGAVCSGQETGTAADSSTGSSRIGNASAGNAVRTEEEQRRARIMEIYRSFYVQATGQGASAEEARAKARTDTEAYLMEERRKAGEPV